MYLIFMILTGINLLIYIYAFIKDLQIIKENKLFKKVFEHGGIIGKQVEDTFEEQDSKSTKIAYIVGLIIAFIILIGIYGAVIYIPVWVGLKFGINNAIATYLFILIGTTTLRLYKYGSNPDFDAKIMILMSLVALFKFQVMTLILFGFKFTLANIAENIYVSEFFLNDTFTLLFPVLFFCSIILTLYLYWIGLKVNSKLNVDNLFKPKLSHFFLMLIISSFAGLIYIVESAFDFIDNSSGSSFDRMQNIFMFLLASILIPTMLNLLSNKKNRYSEKIDTGKDDEKNIAE